MSNEKLWQRQKVPRVMLPNPGNEETGGWSKDIDLEKGEGDASTIS
jgi:hypothetical protein